MKHPCSFCHAVESQPGQQSCRSCHAAYMRNWRKTHPLTPEQRKKDIARSYANQYLKRGRIERKPCAICGKPAQMHHRDYAKPLEVDWLCRNHHHTLHRMLDD